MKIEKHMTNWQFGGVDARTLRAFLDSHETENLSRTYGVPYLANLIGVDEDGDLASTSAIVSVERRRDATIYVRTASGSLYRLSDDDVLGKRYAIGVTNFSVIPSIYVRESASFDPNALANDETHQRMQEKIRNIILETTSCGSNARIDFPVNSWAIVFRIRERNRNLPEWLKRANTAWWDKRAFRGVSHIERLTKDSIRICMGENIYFYGKAIDYDTLTRKASSPIYVDAFSTCRADSNR